MWDVSLVNMFRGDRENHVQGISDLDVALINGAWHLYVTTRAYAGVTVYELDPARGIAVTDDRQSINVPNGLRPDASEVLSFGGGVVIASLGSSQAAYQGLTVNGNGDINGTTQLAPATGIQASMVAVSQFSMGAADFIIAGQYAHASLQVYSVGAGASLTLAAKTYLSNSDLAALATAKVGTHAYAFAATASLTEIYTYDLSQAGAMTRVSYGGMESTLGYSGITQMETVTLGADTFLVAAAAGSSSISVMRIEANGELIPTDHVFDGPGTRFRDASELKVLEHAGMAFILAAGSDDGLTLFQLMPDGQLILRASQADTLSATLDNVSGLAMVAQGNTLHIYASSEAETGVTQFSVDIGTPGSTMPGTPNDDPMNGTGLDDILSGGDGNDSLNGWAGDDVLCDGAGADRLRGGAGSDLFVMKYDGEVDVILDFEPGIDRIDLSGWQMLRNAGQLTVQSRPYGADIIYGDEFLQVMSHDGRALGAQDLNLAGMIPLEHGYYPYVAPWQTIRGTAQNDMLIGTARNDTIDGDGGDDILVGGRGNDDLAGGTGYDIADYSSAAAGVKIYLEDLQRNTGDAEGDLYSSVEAFRGSDFTDVMVSDQEDHEFFGGHGRDWLLGGGGTDTLHGDGGDDMLFGGANRDQLRGGYGNDHADGGEGNDVIYGADGDDTLLGGADNDRLLGGDGNDNLQGNDGNDVMFSDDGDDTLFGGLGDDSLLASTGDDLLYGENGNDGLYGGFGNDSLHGGAGDDHLEGFYGDDVLNGEADNDLLIGMQGSDTLLGGYGDDTLKGEHDDDFLDGGHGRDLLIGSIGNDLLKGRGGLDTLWGGNGWDTLDGGTEDDILDGGNGSDVLAGGSGADIFIFNHGRDRIIDFNDNVDALQFDPVLWGGGALSAGQILSRYAETAGSAVEFDFGQGNVLVVQNIADASLLLDDILA